MLTNQENMRLKKLLDMYDNGDIDREQIVIKMFDISFDVTKRLNPTITTKPVIM